MSWPPSSHNPAYPDPPERRHSGYPEQPAQSYGQPQSAGYPQNSAGYPQTGSGYPPSPGQPYPADQPTQTFNLPTEFPDDQQTRPYGQPEQLTQPYGYPQNSPAHPSGTTDQPHSSTGYPPGHAGYSSGNSGYPQGSSSYSQDTTGYPQNSAGYPQTGSGYPPSPGQPYPADQPTQTFNLPTEFPDDQQTRPYGQPEQPTQPYGYPQNSPGFPSYSSGNSGYPQSPSSYQQGSGGYPQGPTSYPQGSGGYPQGSGGYRQDPGQAGRFPEPGGQPYAGNQHFTGYTQDPGTSNSEPPSPAPKKSKTGKIVLLVLVAVLVLCGGAGTALYLTVGKPAAEAVNTRVVAPETLAGRPKTTAADLQALTNETVASIKKDVPGATDVVGAVYGDPAKQDMVMMVAASAILADPAKELDDAINGASKSLNVTDVKSIDPGPLGGHAKCGDAKVEGLELAVCAWADNGSLGMVVIYFAKADEKAIAEFVKMRGEIEQKS